MPDEMSDYHRQTYRKIGGSPFQAFAGMPTMSLRWLNTDPDLWKRSDVAEREFCSMCGSTLFIQCSSCPMECCSLTASSIDESKLPLRKPSEYIFVREKAPWFDLPDDGAQRFEALPPKFAVMMLRWLKERSAVT